MSEIELIDHLLQQAKTIAVVGLSNRAERDSYQVAHYLQQQGYRVLGINPLLAGTEVLGEPCYASLAEAQEDTHLRIDIVNCFRRSEEIPAIVDAAIAIKAGAIWMQLGIVNEAAAAQARQAHLEVVMDKCTKVEHKRLCRLA